MPTKSLIVLIVLIMAVITIFSAGCSDKVNEEAVSWNEKGNEYYRGFRKTSIFENCLRYHL